MRRMLVTTALFAVGGGWLAVSAEAQQEQAPRPDRETRECECRFEPNMFRTMFDRMPFAQRARLGILLESAADAETDPIGARIERVVPDGPAERAGLRAGDIIVSLDGERLAGQDERPSRRLVELARELEPGDTVRVEYRRDGETRTAEVIAGEVPVRDLVVAPEMPGRPMVRMHRLLDRMGEMPRAFAYAFERRLDGLELAALNPDLGRYFGTEEGVLVLEVSEESELELRAGDIIRTIGGREVETPGDVRRILRSYVPDEEIGFEITRDRRQMNVTGRVTESEGRPGELRIERRRDR